MPGIPSALVYAAEYQRLIDEKQFSFLLVDKSFFQFFFRFSNGNVVSARLAYYPAPVKISGAMDDIAEMAEKSGVDLLEELYFGAESWKERGIDVVNTSHLRLDYDPQVKSHSPCHIQFGGINEIRIPSVELINPFVFFEWVCKSTSTSKDALEEIAQKVYYKSSIGYHLPRSLNVGGVDESYPHLVSSK